MIYESRHAETARQIQIWFESVAPEYAVTRAGVIAPVVAPDALEAAYVSKAVARRQDEFHTGRRLARAALEALGYQGSSILPSPDRDPVWPVGVAGSISHTQTICVAHLASTKHWRSVGIDIEPLVPFADGLASHICHPDEPQDFALLRFVVKEAVFKAYYPQTRCFLEFKDLKVDLSMDWFTCQLMALEKPALDGRRRFAGPCAEVSGNYVAGLWCPQWEKVTTQRASTNGRLW